MVFPFNLLSYNSRIQKRTRWQAVDTFHEYPEQPEKAVVGINLPENAASLVMIAQ